MIKRRTLLKFLRYFFGGFLIIGSVIALGLLSASGILLIFPTILPLTIVAFLFASIIEIQVHKENILGGLKKFFSPDYVRRSVIISTLDMLCKDKNKLAQSTFLQNYKNQKKYAKKFSGQQLTAEQEEEKRQAKKALKAMQNTFVDFVLADQTKNYDNPFYKQLQSCINDEEIAALKRKIRIRWAVLGISWIFNLAAAVSFLLVTHAAGITAVNALTTALVGLTLSAATLSIILWPVAIGAAVGYVFLSYHTLTGILAKPSVRAWFKKQFSYFVRQESDSLPGYIARIVGSALLLAIVVAAAAFATIATAGTWWAFVEKFPAILAYITIPADAVMSLMFDLKNALKATQKLIQNIFTRKFFSNIAINIKQSMVNTKASENWLQFFNPFRILTKTIELPYKFVVFIGHILSTGVASDNLGDIPPAITAIAGASNDLFSDLPYISDPKHSHSDLPLVILKIALAPLYFVSALWNFTTSRFNHEIKPKLSFGEALANEGLWWKKNNFIAEPKPAANQSYYTIVAKLNKHISRLDNATTNAELAQGKKAAMIAFRDELLTKLNEAPPQNIERVAAELEESDENSYELKPLVRHTHHDDQAQTLSEIVKKHTSSEKLLVYRETRNKLFGNTTKSYQFMDKLREQYPAPRASY